MVEEVNMPQVAKMSDTVVMMYIIMMHRNKLDKATDYCINKQLDEASRLFQGADEN